MTELIITPTVSIGMPVHNGERFLAAALDSILAQTFTDFEVVITDNASCDATEAICRRYEATDRRVRYVRSDENRGAAWNFNYVLSLCRGRYVKWAAHDDVLEPAFLERCVAVLEADPTVALAFPCVALIDQDGARVRLKWRQVRADQASVTARFRAILQTSTDNPEAVFGLMRREVATATLGIGSYAAADHRLLCEVALRGRIHEVPEILFLNRDHPARSVRAVAEPRRRAGWFDPARSARIGLPTWRLGADYATAVLHAPVDIRTRLVCWAQLPWFVWKARRDLVRDLVVLAAARVRPRR